MASDMIKDVFSKYDAFGTFVQQSVFKDDYVCITEDEFEDAMKDSLSIVDPTSFVYSPLVHFQTMINSAPSIKDAYQALRNFVVSKRVALEDLVPVVMHSPYPHLEIKPMTYFPRALVVLQILLRHKVHIPEPFRTLPEHAPYFATVGDTLDFAEEKAFQYLAHVLCALSYYKRTTNDSNSKYLKSLGKTMFIRSYRPPGRFPFSTCTETITDLAALADFETRLKTAYQTCLESVK